VLRPNNARGELFDHLIRNGVYSERDAANFLKQYADALAYIHSKSLIHADLKPENLMLSSFDNIKARVKVVDFGCALSTVEQLKNNVNVLGTMAYWSPEMCHKKQIITPAIDMFATGIIMYILLTGTHPFDPTGEATDEEIVDSIKNLSKDGYFDAAVMDRRTDHLSEDAKGLIRKLMQPNPLLRMKAREFQLHCWVQGSTASLKAMVGSDEKLKLFWQKRFKAAILKKYAQAVGGNGALSDRNLREIFSAIDTDGDNTLDVNEVKTALAGILLRSNDDASDLFKSIDQDQDGRVDFEEFKNILRQSFNDGPGIQTHESGRFRIAVLQRFTLDEHISDKKLRQIFVAIDLNGDGLLQMSELREVLGYCNGIGNEQITKWVDSIDTDLSGGVDFEEFKKAMKKKFDK